MGMLTRWKGNIEKLDDDRLMEAAASMLKCDKPILLASSRSLVARRLVAEMYDPVIKRLEARARELRANGEVARTGRRVGNA